MRLMSEHVSHWKKFVPIRQLALRIIKDVPGHKNWNGQIRAIHQWVQDNIQYVRDVNNVETLQTPHVTLIEKQGDCDDQATLIATLLESIGHPTRFVAIKLSPDGPYAHVFAETRMGMRWIPVETTEPWETGEGPPRFFGRMVVHN